MSVFPVSLYYVRINPLGRTGDLTDYVEIADMENIDLEFDGENIEEWRPLDGKGWKRYRKTGSGLSITLSGKRNIGDPGNDYIAQVCTFGVGTTAESEFELIFPNNSRIRGNCVVSVVKTAGTASTDLSMLECMLLIEDKPLFLEYDEISFLSWESAYTAWQYTQSAWYTDA